MIVGSQRFRYGARLCFSFTGTRLWRRGDPVELLFEPGDLAEWCAEAGLFERPPPVSADELRQALVLREAVQRLGEAVADGGAPAHRDVEVLNTAAARTPLVRVLDVAAVRATWSGADVLAALSVVARDAIEVLASAPRERVRVCAEPVCGGLFVDESRPGRRRWCSMSTCGDRAKKATYRGRLVSGT